MSDNLNFASLVPTRNTFTDADGKRHEFRARVEFGAVDLARITRLQKSVQAALDTLAQAAEDESAAQAVEDQTGEFIALILPTLPSGFVAAMTLGQKSAIVRWWTDHEVAGPNGRVAEGEAQASQPQ